MIERRIGEVGHIHRRLESDSIHEGFEVLGDLAAQQIFGDGGAAHGATTRDDALAGLVTLIDFLGGIPRCVRGAKRMHERGAEPILAIGCSHCLKLAALAATQPR
jgi:hypothetical protein